MELDELLARVPVGWSRLDIEGRPWAISRVIRADGRSETLWAEDLSAGDSFGANIWRTSAGTILRPCEVPAERVTDLLSRIEPGAILRMPEPAPRTASPGTA